MHSEILNKLKSLLESDDVLAVRREFNSLKSQFKSLPLDHLPDEEKPAPESDDHDTDVAVSTSDKPAKSAPEVPEDSKIPSKSDSETTDSENTEIPPAPHSAEQAKPARGYSGPNGEDKVSHNDATNPVGITPGLDPQISDGQPDQKKDLAETGEKSASEDAGGSPSEEKDDESQVGSPPTTVSGPPVEPKEDQPTDTPDRDAPLAEDPKKDPEGETPAMDAKVPENHGTEQGGPAPKEPEEDISAETKKASEDNEEAAGDERDKSSETPTQYEPDAILAEFHRVVDKFNEKIKNTKEEKEKIERETIAEAKDLIEEIKSLVADEENIGKAFARFNAIQERWKSLPKVSNDAYRDLNVEYNKYLEEFFYNINIYKELKELDLKRNLEEKHAVLENQKKLLDENDIRLLEVEVRLNQDRWNEIGPTFREDWVKIKDEFWNITRRIYSRIHDFYQDRREEQEKNLLKKKELLETTRHLVELDLKSTKKWHEKSEQIKELQNEWRMIGFVPKKDSRDINREFRKLCDEFFDRKRAFHAEIKQVQDANREAKEKIIERAEAIKDSEDWAETANQLIALQKEWKAVGPAFQRDENRLWKKFRGTCNHFFNRRKEHHAGRNDRELENLQKKQALLQELEDLDVKTTDDPIASLRTYHERWREIGHVPMRDKKALDKKLAALMDQKYGKLDIDRDKRRRIQFEEHVENLKEKDHSDRLIRKEEDIVRNKITKLQAEIHQLENNMGFFADTKGAEKYKKEIQKQIDGVRATIEELQDQIKILRKA